MPEIIGIDHIYLTAPDLEQSAAFYDAVITIPGFKKRLFQINMTTGNRTN
jgi:catechol 2,3-dioxygenase-like lactoylglutathione lyase family enzyme